MKAVGLNAPIGLATTPQKIMDSAMAGYGRAHARKGLSHGEQHANAQLILDADAGANACRLYFMESLPDVPSCGQYTVELQIDDVYIIGDFIFDLEISGGCDMNFTRKQAEAAFQRTALLIGKTFDYRLVEIAN